MGFANNVIPAILLQKCPDCGVMWYGHDEKSPECDNNYRKNKEREEAKRKGLDEDGYNEHGVAMCVCGNKSIHAWEPGEWCSPDREIPGQ